MPSRFHIRYKSGVEVQYSHKPISGPYPPNIRLKFDAYIKSGKQDIHTFEFRDRTDNTANSNIFVAIDFREISSITEYEL